MQNSFAMYIQLQAKKKKKKLTAKCIVNFSHQWCKAKLRV